MTATDTLTRLDDLLWDLDLPGSVFLGMAALPDSPGGFAVVYTNDGGSGVAWLATVFETDGRRWIAGEPRRFPNYDAALIEMIRSTR